MESSGQAACLRKLLTGAGSGFAQAACSKSYLTATGRDSPTLSQGWRIGGYPAASMSSYALSLVCERMSERL
ncbi:hypothetical protein [Desulfitobacterium sp.]|uniref:hypothetical protein n=1 Tax=Desulfitobacterium sp. TaxID=49981 RepID=UPI002CFF53B9|nr:hypothetical protein [Desulfitobacterium sp.]HVJ50320.1 hypothetical protein [Desulfitobacterium sp.]